jgi:hypothetical protein
LQESRVCMPVLCLGFLIWAVRDSFDGEIPVWGRSMSQPRHDRQDDLFRPPLEEIINLRHPLVRLAGEIDWDFLGEVECSNTLRHYAKVQTTQERRGFQKCKSNCPSVLNVASRDFQI